MNKITVIVPVYNVENYISQCVDSLLDQTYEEYEVIFVDDGSKDKSVDIIHQKIKANTNFKVVTKQNGGLSSARNFGMQFVTGEFVTFVDSDDYLDRTYLEKMRSAIGNANICCCGYNEVSEFGGFIREVRNEVDFANSETDVYGKVIEAINFIPNAWGKIYRRDVFEKLHYPEGLLFEDYAIAYKVFYQEKVCFLDEPLYFYRIRNGSIMREFNKKIVSDKFIILKEILDFLIEKKIADFYRTSYIDSYLHHGIFVTSCVIINQSKNINTTVNYLKELVKKTDGKIFNLKNVIISRTLPSKEKYFLLTLLLSPKLACFLKSMHKKVGGLNA